MTRVSECRDWIRDRRFLLRRAQTRQPAAQLQGGLLSRDLCRFPVPTNRGIHARGCRNLNEKGGLENIFEVELRCST